MLSNGALHAAESGQPAILSSRHRDPTDNRSITSALPATAEPWQPKEGTATLASIAYNHMITEP